MKALRTWLVCLILGLYSLSVRGFETVVVDPGHGGNDEGTKWYHVSEKDLSLAVSNRLTALLRAKGIHVVQTRVDDRYVALDDRAAIANRSRNSLLVSIHFNASDTTTASGFQTYHFFASPTGKVIAESIQQSLCDKIVARSRGVTKKDYAVLARTNDCAVLVECGFISNKTEALYYASEEGQEAMAEALAAGILRVKPVINSDPPECEEAKCILYAAKSAATQRKLALGGGERIPGEPHTGQIPHGELVALVRPVKLMLAQFKTRFGGG
jgi:N-acetylmuramoyl-L-alanine amidase